MIFEPSAITGTQELIQAYGLWVLFGLVASEGMGVPLPGETALVAAALYAGSTHRIDILAVIAVAGTAAIIGDNIGYLIGRWLGHPLLARYGRHVRLTEARLERARDLFARHGGTIVFFGRFVALLRTLTALMAGANHMRWRQFLVMDMLGAMSWAALVGGGVYLFGEQARRLSLPLGLLVPAAIAIGMILLAGWHHRRGEKTQRAGHLQSGR